VEFQVSDSPSDGSAEQVIASLQAANAQLDRRIFDLSALLKAGDALHDVLEVEPLSALLIAMVRERVQVDQLALFLNNPETGLVELQAHNGLPDDVDGLSFPAEDGILWRLLLAGEPFSVLDLGGRPRFPEIFDVNQLEQVQGRLWLPLVMPGKVIGLLSIGLGRDGNPVDVAELSFLSSLANQAALAINSARLYQSIEVARRRLDRSLHQLSMLFDVTRALSAVSDLTGLLRLILERAIDAVDAEKGSLMLMNEAGEELEVRVVFGLPDKEIERKINEGELTCRTFKPGEGVAGTVLQTGKPHRVDNTEDEGSFTDRETSHVRSILCVPLTVEDDTLGVINITNRKGTEPFRDEDEEILGALADQAAVAIARARLYEAAITDGLTGLYIRRFVMHRLREEVRRTRRYGNQLSVVMCDIDHFKQVNDNHGHPAGDAVLVRVADVLRAGLRTEVDVAGRYGGEEFLLLLPQTTARAAVVAAERLRKSTEQLRVDVGDDEPLQVTMSFGIAELDIESGEGPAELIARADAALYASKEAGRNRVTAFGTGEGSDEAEPGDDGGFTQDGDTLRRLRTLKPEALGLKKQSTGEPGGADRPAVDEASPEGEGSD